ncbi:ATP-dependent DNA helicase RecG [Nocardia amikacinitolerans]|uniref:ATP-dependent DNA helicase RecG n=1 Tax=Nocardia amikacinitolerans TaxID=756689 RepID=A0A285L4E2_9NOCA|nr:peptide synthetase [Nocardia amikacinitolerans]SNY79744.1 ATP-dependent DNA helicase RecG [Nocardia amikacinitolerans]
MSSDTTFRRPITPTERLYFATRELAPPFLMQLAVHGQGTLDPADLQRAVDVASAANPGSRLVRDGADWVDTGVAATVRVVEGHSLTYPGLENDPVLNSPIGPTPDRTCEVLLLTADPVTIVFRVFHGVMDGMGMRMWVDDVFRALRGVEPFGAPDPVADAELVARVGAPGKPSVLLPIYPSAAGRGKQDPAESPWLLRHRTVAATGRGIVARVAAVLADAAQAKSRFMIPVDLRRHDPALRSTANLALPLFLDVAPGDTWESVNDQLRAGLKENRELNQMDNGGLTAFPPAVVRAVLRAGNWVGARLGRNLVSATVSHMGVFDLPEMAVPGFTPVSIRVLPQHSGMMPLLFGIVESAGRLEITVSCRNGEGVEARLEALLDRIASTLERELAASPTR